MPSFLSKFLQKGIWPPGGYGFSLRLSGLTLGVGGVLIAAVVAWAFFMGFWVGRGQNPEQKLEQMRAGLAPGSQTAAEVTEKAAQSGEAQSGKEQESGLAVSASEQQGQAAPPAGQPVVQDQSGKPAQPDAQTRQSGTSGQGPGQNPDGKARKTVAPNPAQPGQTQKPQAAGMAKAERQVKDERQGKAESQAGKQKQANPKKDKQQAAAKQEPTRQGKPVYDYVYQVAASKSEADAKNLAQKLAAAGHKSGIQKSGKVWLVVFSLRGTEDDAARVKKSAQTTLGKAVRGKILRLSKNEVGKKPEQAAGKGRK